MTNLYPETTAYPSEQSDTLSMQVAPFDLVLLSTDSVTHGHSWSENSKWKIANNN